MLSDQQLSMTLRALEEIFWKTYPLGEDDIVLLYWYRAWYSDRLIKWSEIIKSARENNSWQNLLSYNTTADEYNGQWHWNSNLLWNYHNQLNYFTMVQVHVQVVGTPIIIRALLKTMTFITEMVQPGMIFRKMFGHQFACRSKVNADYLHATTKFVVCFLQISCFCRMQNENKGCTESFQSLTHMCRVNAYLRKFHRFHRCLLPVLLGSPLQTLKTTAYITLSKSTINTP